MTFEQLQEVNKEINALPIKGKDYATVNQRILAFRKIHPNGTINTELVSNENGVCIIKAMVSDDEGKVLGTGYAYEKEDSTFINKTSYIENCETSAVGRALGMLGIGIDVSIASAEEVQNAIIQQNNDAVIDAKDLKALKALMKRKGIESNGYNGKPLNELTTSVYFKLVAELNNKPDKE